MMNHTPWIDTVQSMDSQTTETDDDEGYYGQDVLEGRDNPDLDVETDDDGFQGEGSWMDWQKDEDGEGSRYDRGDSTNWTEDAALQFDTDLVDDLTTSEMDFSEEEREAFSEPGQTLDGSGDPAESRDVEEMLAEQAAAYEEALANMADRAGVDTSGGLSTAQTVGGGIALLALVGVASKYSGVV